MKVMALDGCLHAGRVEYVLHGDPAIKRVFKTDMSHNLGGSCLISPAKYTIDLLNHFGRKAPSSPFRLVRPVQSVYLIKGPSLDFSAAILNVWGKGRPAIYDAA
jgi:hypothetical protein